MNEEAVQGEQVSTGAVTVSIEFLASALGEKLPPCPDWPDLN